MELIVGIVAIFIVTSLGLFLRHKLRKKPDEIQIQIDDTHVIQLLNGKTIVWNHQGQGVFLLHQKFLSKKHAGG